MEFYRWVLDNVYEILVILLGQFAISVQLLVQNINKADKNVKYDEPPW